MKHNKTVAHSTHVLPSKDLYYHNKRSTPLERKGEEFYGNKNYDKAARKDLQSAESHFLRDVDGARNTDTGDDHFTRKRSELHTKWTDQPHVEHTSPKKERVHLVPTQAQWTSVDHN